MDRGFQQIEWKTLFKKNTSTSCFKVKQPFPNIQSLLLCRTWTWSLSKFAKAQKIWQRVSLWMFNLQGFIMCCSLFWDVSYTKNYIQYYIENYLKWFFNCMYMKYNWLFRHYSCKNYKYERKLLFVKSR